MNEDPNTIALLDRATSDLVPDIDRLVEGGVRRGRIRRRRRRIGTTLAAAAVVGVVGVIGVAASLAPGLPGESTTGNDAGQVADPVKPKPPVKEKTPVTARHIAVRAKQLPGLVADLFPGTITPAAADTGRIIDDGADAQVAHFQWNGFMTSVGIWRGNSADDCGPAAAGKCVQLPDGSLLSHSQETGPAVDGAVTGRGAFLYTTDGWAIFVMSYNAADGKDSPTLADEPPFDFDQLEQIVMSDAWLR
jgi:hypothetical protein